MRLISRPRHSNLRLPAPRIDLATPPASHAARRSPPMHAPRATQYVPFYFVGVHRSAASHKKVVLSRVDHFEMGIGTFFLFLYTR